jgi:predicted P-loop ATPase
VLVIGGPQGCGKSSALRLLAIKDDWYTDDFPLDERRLMEATLDKWIVEACELMAMEVAALKASLARTHDTSRRAFAREVTRKTRQFVIVGTTSEADYLYELNDLPGNRRLFIVRISGFDLDRLRVMRDRQLREIGGAP